MVMELLNVDLAYHRVRQKTFGSANADGASPGAKSRNGQPPIHDTLTSARPMSAREYRDLCGARQALEIYAAGLAAQNRTDEQLAELRLPLEAMRRIGDHRRGFAGDRAVLDRLVREEVRFHLGIVAIARNAWLVKEVLRLRLVHRVVETALRAKPVHTLDERRRIEADHEEIFAAIARGDRGSARSAMERHLQHSPARLRS